MQVHCKKFCQGFALRQANHKKTKLQRRCTTLRSAELLGEIRVGGWDARVTTEGNLQKKKTENITRRNEDLSNSLTPTCKWHYPRGSPVPRKQGQMVSGRYMRKGGKSRVNVHPWTPYMSQQSEAKACSKK